MSMFDVGPRLAPVRTGRFADPATALAWLLGLVAAAVHPAGLAVAGVALAVVATSVERAVASGVVFGLSAVALGWVWLVATGSPPLAVPVAPGLQAVAALVVPPVVAGVLRAIA